MFRAVRCTTALLTVLTAAACGDAPTAPGVRPKAPDAQALRAVPDSVIPRTSADCDPETGDGCCWDTQPWWC